MNVGLGPELNLGCGYQHDSAGDSVIHTNTSKNKNVRWMRISTPKTRPAGTDQFLITPNDQITPTFYILDANGYGTVVIQPSESIKFFPKSAIWVCRGRLAKVPASSDSNLIDNLRGSG